MYSIQHTLPLRYFLLVFIISVPFWLIGALPEDALRQLITINLPISSLMFVCPVIAAALLVYWQQGKAGVQQLLKKTFDYRNITNKLWYVAIISLVPFILVLSYIFMRLMNIPLPDVEIQFLIIAIFFVVFFVSAAGEELGWQGYAFEPMQDRWGALRAAIILGIIWAVWHIVPYIQAERSASWIFWHCLSSVAMRVLIVWIYNNTGKSVFSAIMYHAMINVSIFLFPNLGSHYDPVVTAVITWIIAGVVIFVWGPRTLAQYRYAQIRTT